MELTSKRTIRELAADLAAGRITSVALTAQMLARAEAHRAQGGHAYVSLDGEQALAEARASDARAHHPTAHREAETAKAHRG